MASFASAARLSSRLAARQLRPDAAARGYRTSAACLAAQNFTMPALSPTMMEGNIARWRFKEGDSFAAGDVLLEIETDKASMDVEAQDDGMIAKITQGDGTKGIPVGTRIGVLAEPGDDLSTLEIPAEEASAASSQPAPEKEAAPSSTSTSSPPPAVAAEQSNDKPTKAAKQKYPLMPSVAQLLHEKGIPASEYEKIVATGPQGRLLKGDVLAYIGSIKSSYPKELSDKLEKLGHLDLSNIKIVPAAAPKKKEAPVSVEPAAPVEKEVALPISIATVLEVQQRIKNSLGTHIPLSTFIARATDLANDDLPRSKFAKPTADELFNEVLGLNKLSSQGVRGDFIPLITTLPPTAIATMPRSTSSPVKSDIIDILSGKSRPTTPIAKKTTQPIVPGDAATTNIFSVSVPAGDERRAQVFLERVKVVLEGEPGRLVI